MLTSEKQVRKAFKELGLSLPHLHQRVCEWQRDKTSEERWGRRMKDAISTNVIAIWIFSPLQSFHQSLLLPLWADYQWWGNSRQSGIQSHTASLLFLCHCVHAGKHFWNTTPHPNNLWVYYKSAPEAIHIYKKFWLSKLSTITPMITKLLQSTVSLLGCVKLLETIWW